MQDKVIEEVFNRLQSETVGDNERLKAALGTFVKDCIEAKQAREMKGRPFETDIFVENYRFDLLDEESKALLENRDRIVALENAVGANTDTISELFQIVEELRSESKSASRFWPIFWKNYLAGVVVALTFPFLILLSAFLIALAFGIDFSPASVANAIGEWLSRLGGS